MGYMTFCYQQAIGRCYHCRKSLVWIIYIIPCFTANIKIYRRILQKITVLRFHATFPKTHPLVQVTFPFRTYTVHKTTGQSPLLEIIRSFFMRNYILFYIISDFPLRNRCIHTLPGGRCTRGGKDRSHHGQPWACSRSFHPIRRASV